MMLLLTSFLFISSSLAATLPEGVDDLDNVTLEEFLEDFGLDEVDDPKEMAAMQEALAENEEVVKEANEAYANGEQTWFDEINDFDDEPIDEFMAEHTGLLTNFTYGFAKGLLDIPIEYDEASERYFDQFRYSRSALPDSYNAVTEGLVSPIKDQGYCGSCVAFATTALIETCFKKVTGEFGDYSEQLLVDCAYDYRDSWNNKLANGCKGAAGHGYAKWLVDTKPKLSSEKAYPYTDYNNVAWNSPSVSSDPKTCPATYKSFSQGAVITGGYWTDKGDEETLKRLVVENGAVLTLIKAHGGFHNYKGGVFEGCEPNVKPDHAVAVVGYGTENGQDYWLVKNSWGTSKGENGYYKLQRGVRMCGLGDFLVTLACGKEKEPTTAAPTTAAPTTASHTTTTSSSCADSDPILCPIYKYLCWSSEEVKESCPETCGLCSESATECKDDYGTAFCSSMAMFSCNFNGDKCKKSCNRC